MSVDVSPSENSAQKSGWKKELWDWTKTVVVSFAIVMLLHLFVFNLSTVEGHSMEPTLHEKEWLFINKLVYLFEQPKFGDIVILEDPMSPAGEQELLVKRIIGVPGDRLEIYNKQLYRNGDLVEETYVDSVIEDLDFMPIQLEKGGYFVMGDNRHARASKDSRIFGTIQKSMIRGRAEFIIWPFGQFKVL
ncbi:signal peptidase I [Paenibacillus sp. NEAU-GSW1]|uniref:signal peptidase I n=1 Tax=Paenibacillus sp. NEAU-GSW1 TaxID=2682486 RepID=UPI0012E2BE4D|nr:signal peptidase I [Paenibacillus sp. NEAU-GSW1]MUT65571.1 signal peptidase I [Paenibacillus sp. NEAU-GSW1]